MSLIIKISDKTKERLNSLRIHHRETWDDVIERILDKELKKYKNE